MVGTLFLTFCDMEMGKIVTALLSKQTLDMAEMRAQVRNLEASLWYKGNKATTKLAGSAGTTGLGESGGLGISGKWCTHCQRAKHNMDSCWVQCIHCGGRGHRSKTCRNKNKTEEAKSRVSISAAEARESPMIMKIVLDWSKAGLQST